MSRSCSTPASGVCYGRSVADGRITTLERFIRNTLLVDRRTPILPTTPLLSDGLLDSVGVAQLAVFVEEQFGVPFDDSDLRAGRRETIADILALVDRRS